MAFTWSPAIWHSDYGAGNIYLLPQPVTQLTPQHTWKVQSHEIPRTAGGSSYGLSERPPTINISGEFGKNASGVIDSEQEMWTEFETLKSKLAAADDAEKLELFLYYDLGSGTYRKYKNVRPVSVEPSLGDADRIVFRYSLVLVAEDTTIYTTAPGS